MRCSGSSSQVYGRNMGEEQGESFMLSYPDQKSYIYSFKKYIFCYLYGFGVVGKIHTNALYSVFHTTLEAET